MDCLVYYFLIVLNTGRLTLLSECCEVDDDVFSSVLTLPTHSSLLD